MSLLGWRQWAVDAQGQLRPAWTPWSPFPPELLLWRPDGVTEARCLRLARPDRDRGAARRTPPHLRTPADGCVCGLYAWRDPDTLLVAPRPRWTSLPVVVGAARLGGRVVVADRGYRAQLGYPVAVLDPGGVVSPRYAVARYRTWDALVAEWHPAGGGTDLEARTSPPDA
jgi:hypothetical protein